jgi:hypothetical protein
LFEKFAPAKDELLALQKTAGVKMTIVANVWTSGGVVLWPKQMKELSELDLELQIAISDYSQTD